MTVNDILLLSDRLAEEPNQVGGEAGAAVIEESSCCGSNIPKIVEKPSCCSNNDESSSKVKVVSEARERAIETVVYYSACDEQGSEHPIAKGMLFGNLT